MVVKKVVWAALAAVAVSSSVRAAETPADVAHDYVVQLHRDSGSKPLSLDLASVNTDATNAAGAEEQTDSPPRTLNLVDIVPTDKSSGFGLALHGFADMSFRTAYITPRGLAVENQGVVFQALGGLVFDIYNSDDGFINNVSLVIGAWSSIHSHHPGGENTHLDVWNEFDSFAGINTRFMKDFTFSFTYMDWVSPINAFDEERNLEFKLSYSDHWFEKYDFTLNPYLSCFYNFAGGSPVVMGATNGSFYLEPGIVPTYTWKGLSSDYPITFSAPTYIQVGDGNFWSASDSSPAVVGLFSTGLKASVPLAFIPKEYGNWNAYVGFSYYHVISDDLHTANELVGSGDSRDLFVGYTGVGFGF